LVTKKLAIWRQAPEGRHELAKPRPITYSRIKFAEKFNGKYLSGSIIMSETFRGGSKIIGTFFIREIFKVSLS
jgi:hypothetical protein